MSSIMQTVKGAKANMAHLVLKMDTAVIGSTFHITDFNNDIYAMMIRAVDDTVQKDPEAATESMMQVAGNLGMRHAWLENYVAKQKEYYAQYGVNPEITVCNVLSAITPALNAQTGEIHHVQLLKTAMSVITNDGAPNDYEVSDLILYLDETKTKWVDSAVQ